MGREVTTVFLWDVISLLKRRLLRDIYARLEALEHYSTDHEVGDWPGVDRRRRIARRRDAEGE